LSDLIDKVEFNGLKELGNEESNQIGDGISPTKQPSNNAVGNQAAKIKH